MYPSTINHLEMFEVADDFVEAGLNTVRWTDLNDGATGTNTINATAGGEISLVTAAAANDYHFLYGAKSFLPAKGKPAYFVARFVAGTQAGMQYAGLSSVVAASIATDTTGVVSTNFSGAMFFVLPASLALGITASNGTTQASTASLLTLVAGQAYQVGFHIDPADGVTARVKPWVFDETAGTKTDGPALNIPLASIAAMAPIFGVKSAGAAETFKFDYVRAAQKR